MSDLESVDLSQESESEASEDMTTQKTQPPVSNSTKNTTVSIPQHAQRDPATKPTIAGAQNGNIANDRRKKPHSKATASPDRPAATSRPASQTQRTLAQQPVQKPIEKPTEQGKANDPPKTALVKGKRGRPRKVKLLQGVGDDAVAEQQASPRTTASRVAPKATAGPKITAPPKPVTAPKTAPAPRQTALVKEVAAPKAGVKPADGEPPRTAGRGRKRRLATKPVKTTQAQNRQDKQPNTGTSNSQPPQVSEQGELPHKQVAKPTERKLYGAAKAAAMKRKRDEEEGRVVAVPASKSRGKKKDPTGTPEVTEIPTSPPQRGRAPKRVRRQLSKDVPRQVAQEVIRIEDDEVPTEEQAAPASQENSNPATSTAGNIASAGNVTQSGGRQSLPSSFARPARRGSKVRDEAIRAPVNHQPDDPSDDLPRATDEAPSPDRVPDIRIQTQNEFAARPASHVRTRRAHAVRRSTGNMGTMDVDDIPKSDARKHRNRVSNDEAVKTLLDEIQRNAIPFLLTQDRICDKFSSRIGEDVDFILKNSDNDVFQVFTDRVKDALVADRLRLAAASAKTDLRRGIEELLREFARKVGAPLAEADSSLLLRNEAFRSHSQIKEDRKVLKPPPFASPRILKPVTPRRAAEDSTPHEEASDRDDLSDAGDPIITTPRQPPTYVDIPSMANAADVKKFVGYSYETLNLGCFRSAVILKLCAQPGGMALDKIHELTPLGRNMIRNKAKNLKDRGYLVEDVIREGDKNVSVYSTAIHVSDS